MRNGTDPNDTWRLFRGDQVVALRDLEACPTAKGMVGVVFEERDAYGNHEAGPMVRWENGAACNVYPGDARYIPSGDLRPSLLTVVQTFAKEDPNLDDSTCGCCEGKRQVMAGLRAKAPWVLEAGEGK